VQFNYFTTPSLSIYTGQHNLGQKKGFLVEVKIVGRRRKDRIQFKKKKTESSVDIKNIIKKSKARSQGFISQRRRGRRRNSEHKARCTFQIILT
jgi:hypothetical protein